MIPVLFKANATNFSTYGIGTLVDTISCQVTEERNGAYECEMSYPITGQFYAEIQKERLIKVKPNDTSANQMFRIYRITKPLNGIVKIYAQHISYDLTTIATPAYAATDIMPQLAMDAVFNNALIPHSFTFRTDYTNSTDSFGTEEKITEEALRSKAETYLKNNPLGVEDPTLKVSFEPLWKQPEYAAILERVSLCDRVTIKHNDLGVKATAKVVTTVYDTLAEKYISITLGSAKSTLIDTISDTQREIESATEKVDRLPSLMASAIQNATQLITGQSGGYVVLRGDDTGHPYELLVMDAPTIDAAVNIWRWNVGGLGFSSHGYNGPYETAITADGAIVADFITSGTLVANIIKAGTLSSQDGSSYWNLETGEVLLRAYATTESVEETNTRIDEINEQKMYRLVITSSNGNIFKNGNINTTLTATVFSWDDNITDTLDSNQFIWTRVSDDAEADKEWNAAHFGGAKSIEITSDDVNVRATFFCDLIDTTTRKSLLG